VPYSVNAKLSARVKAGSVLMEHAWGDTGRDAIMTTDGIPPGSTAPDGVDKEATDPPVYREAATPEEIEESQKRDDKKSES
jgi:hypothetical protein